MKITKRQLIKLIREAEGSSIKDPMLAKMVESHDLITPRNVRRLLNEERERRSEMKEFAVSRSGQRVAREGKKITSVAEVLSQVADDQTGLMAETLNRMSEFVAKVGNGLSQMGMIVEGDSLSTQFPTPSELKILEKAIKRLER